MFYLLTPMYSYRLFIAHIDQKYSIHYGHIKVYQQRKVLCHIHPLSLGAQVCYLHSRRFGTSGWKGACMLPTLKNKDIAKWMQSLLWMHCSWLGAQHRSWSVHTHTHTYILYSIHINTFCTVTEVCIHIQYWIFYNR